VQKAKIILLLIIIPTIVSAINSMMQETIIVNVYTPDNLTVRSVIVHAKLVTRGGHEVLVETFELKPSKQLLKNSQLSRIKFPLSTLESISTPTPIEFILFEVFVTIEDGTVLREIRVVQPGQEILLDIPVSPIYSWRSTHSFDNECNVQFSWRLKKTIDIAETMTHVDNGLPTRYENGEHWVAVPFLVIHNYDKGGKGTPDDGVLAAYLEIGPDDGVRFGMISVAGPNLTDRIVQGDWIAALAGEVEVVGDSFTSERIVIPVPTHATRGGETSFGYIFARPIVRLLEELVTIECNGNVQEVFTGYQRIDVYIEDFLIYYSTATIDVALFGEVLFNDTPEWMVDFLVVEGGYSYLEDIRIPRTPLEDGVLEPDEVIILEAVVSHLDSSAACETHDYAIPVGLTLAAASAEPDYGWLGLGVSLPMIVGPSPIGYAEAPGVIGNSMNGLAPEEMFVAVSVVEYRRDPGVGCLWCEPCYYRLPLYIFVGR